jgi:hypothetical protein
MDLGQLRERTCTSLLLLAPQLEDPSPLVDGCLENARRAFRDEFLGLLSPDAWAKVTLVYYKHFLDTGCDISIAEIVAAVVRDSINTKRMDLLTLSLAQHKRERREKAHGPPSLTLVKD